MHVERKPSFAASVLALACLAALSLGVLPALAQDNTAPGAAPAATPPAPAPAGRGATPKLRSSAPVTLNFVNADIEAVSRAMSAMIDQPILVDPRVKGAITVYSEQPIPVREAWLSYLAALRGLGFALVDANGLLKVVPEAEAKLQTGTVSIGPVQQRGDQVLTQVFRLNHENPNNLVAVLRPLISPNNTINANPGTSSLVITDYADNLARLGRIIAALDQPAATEIDVVQLQHAVASDVATLVQRLGEGGAAAAPGIPGGTAATSVLADPRSNSLIIRAANPARLASMRSLISRLDRPGGDGPAGNIYVVHLKNADAAKLASVLRAAFAGGAGASGGSAGSSGVSFGGTGATPASPMTPQAGAAGGTGSGLSAAASTPVAQSASPSTGGFIQADPATNSLIITAAEPLYRQMRTVIDQLDGRRAQVYIESMIVEVSGDNAADFGFQWQGLIGKEGDKYGVFTGTNTSIGGPNIIDLTLAGLGVGGTTGGSASSIKPGEGFNIGLLRNYGGTYALAAIARLLQSQTNTNIVSTPNLITLDNEEAKIIVGSNVPFITGQFTQTGGTTTNPFQTIERKDVGITLRIKPQVGEGGTVRMVIFQESSSVSDKVAPGTSNAGPSTDKRSIESTVVVDDGAILVLGGLIEDKFTERKSKVPLLGDIPYVGQLFRSESRTKTRTNLMVFLRPIVMRDADSVNKLSLDRYDLIRARQQGAQPAPHPMLPVGEMPVIPPIVPPEQPKPAAPLPTPSEISPPQAPANPPGAKPAAGMPPAPAASGVR